MKKALLKNQQGQIILTLVVTIAALVLGAGAARRAVTTQRQASFSFQASKAQKFADAGAEDALAPTTDLDAKVGTTTNLDVDNADGDGNNDTGTDVTYTVTAVGGGSDPITFTLKKDETRQIELTNTSLTQVRISWNGDATIVYSVIHDDSAGNVTLQQKGASDPNETDACSLPSGSSSPTVTAGSGFDHQITGSGLTVGAGEKLYLRVRPLCETNVDIQVEGLDAGGAAVSLPTQGHKITSTGTFGESEWTVEVTKMNPALPSIFDYAIFSEADLTK